MIPQKLYIKSMVCPRCIEAVKNTLLISEIPFKSIELGEVGLKDTISETQKKRLRSKLSEIGFELLESFSSKLIASIKNLIIEQIHHSPEPLKVNFSTYLSERLNHDYSYLSRLFSSVESITIERFITAQRIERVKELIIYAELTLSQIAHKMNYSSVAHLSAQFKKETGLTPSAFKTQQNPRRRSLDKL